MREVKQRGLTFLVHSVSVTDKNVSRSI